MVDIFLIASIISALLFTLIPGSKSFLYGVRVTWNRIGLLIDDNLSTIGIGFLVQNTIASTSSK